MSKKQNCELFFTNNTPAVMYLVNMKLKSNEDKNAPHSVASSHEA